MAQKCYLFWRVDDVEALTPRLLRLLRLFGKYGYPACLQIVPGQLDPDLPRSLQDLRRSLGTRVLVSQHGYTHANHGEAPHEYEFGPTRSRSVQSADILAGRQILANAFGQDFFPAFTPPNNSFDQNTLMVLDQLGYRVLSQEGRRYLGAYSFADFSVNIDALHDYTTLEPTPLKALCHRVESLAFPDSVIGIMVHHELMNNQAFHILEELMSWLFSVSSIEHTTFEHLARRV